MNKFTVFRDLNFVAENLGVEFFKGTRFEAKLCAYLGKHGYQLPQPGLNGNNTNLDGKMKAYLIANPGHCRAINTFRRLTSDQRCKIYNKYKLKPLMVLEFLKTLSHFVSFISIFFNLTDIFFRYLFSCLSIRPWLFYC
ncbi:uncharacterized protein [Gossypium hirsutum]|uniref:Uncharacterized protein isoform X1 n=1 Tax=Gossypium hirsutum TaxID=3635 RepID=A0ABM3BH41_GOSHI|nr:uncharacterized protein LOC121226793 isoform X1 [Gossypium hirsutum]XP_040966384.1 uncharacterized protein LOC121226793 isoform X1 [Gossypium hirsutum]